MPSTPPVVPPFVIREAVRGDAPAIEALVRELAAFERMEHEMTATAADFERTLFAADPKVHALVCSVDGTTVGCAIYFFNYSTWLGRHGLFLEDLYVRESVRGRGLGRALLARLARIAVERGCGRFEWNVLDWNADAIGVYESLGARPQEGWVGYRLTGDALAALARE